MVQPAFRLTVIRFLSGTALLALAGQAGAQTAPPEPVQVVSRPVVQPIPQKSAGMRLNDALGRLARNPQDASAMIEAGKASLELGDAQAAIGFYQRSLQIEPGNARTRAALAGAHVMAEDPFTAIELFDEAEKAGLIVPEFLADRGLAFDLVGDFQTAQVYYRQSLAGGGSDETLRRLALSQAIARDRLGMEQTLAPLLEKQDKAAWRTRALGLAILGQADEAEAIARQTMPAEMATAITAYLRYMPRLTAAQQAGAGNLGRFPRAAEIGHDDPRLAYYSRSRGQVAAAPIQAATKPAPAPVPPPEPVVGREVTAPPTTLAAVTVPPKPSLPPLSQRPAPAPAPKPAPAPPQRKPASIDEAFAGFEAPSREVAVQAGAVDVTRIRPVASSARSQAGKAKAPAKESKPAVPSHPSRIWVQVATGRGKAALGFDWRKLARENPALFKSQKPSVTATGQSNRLLAGPFTTAKSANAFLTALKKAGVGDAFVWTSPAGQLVDALGGGK